MVAHQLCRVRPLSCPFVAMLFSRASFMCVIHHCNSVDDHYCCCRDLSRTAPNTFTLLDEPLCVSIECLACHIVSCYNPILVVTPVCLTSHEESLPVSYLWCATGSSGMLTVAGTCCGTFALTGWCRYQRAALMSLGRWSAAITVSCACSH